MLSDERSKINDLFEAEANALHAKIAAQKEPKHAMRAKIISGELTEFADYMTPYEERNARVDEDVKKINAKKSAKKFNDKLKNL